MLAVASLSHHHSLSCLERVYDYHAAGMMPRRFYNFLVQVLVALGRSEWFSKVIVSATLPVGLTPAVIVAKPVPA